MRFNRLAYRGCAVFLAFCLAVPSPVFALRQAGLEENSEREKFIAQLTAGLEEKSGFWSRRAFLQSLGLTMAAGTLLSAFGCGGARGVTFPRITYTVPPDEALTPEEREIRARIRDLGVTIADGDLRLQLEELKLFEHLISHFHTLGLIQNVLEVVVIQPANRPGIAGEAYIPQKAMALYVQESSTTGQRALRSARHPEGGPSGVRRARDLFFNGPLGTAGVFAHELGHLVQFHHPKSGLINPQFVQLYQASRDETNFVFFVEPSPRNELEDFAYTFEFLAVFSPPQQDYGGVGRTMSNTYAHMSAALGNRGYETLARKMFLLLDYFSEGDRGRILAWVKPDGALFTVPAVVEQGRRLATDDLHLAIVDYPVVRDAQGIRQFTLPDAFMPIPPSSPQYPDRRIFQRPPAAGLEEVVSALPVIPVKTFSDVDLRATKKIYLIQEKLEASDIEGLLKNRDREYSLYGFEAQGQSHVTVGIGNRDEVLTDRVLLPALHQHRNEVTLKLFIHNHPQSTAFPSKGDLRGTWSAETSMVAERNFIYGSKIGRIVEFGSGQPRPTDSYDQIRLRVWREGKTTPKEERIHGTNQDWLVSDMRRQRLRGGELPIRRFYRAIRDPSVVKVEVDDYWGNWVRWDRSLTLTRILQEADMVKPFAGLEEPGQKGLRAWREEVQTQEEVVGLLPEALKEFLTQDPRETISRIIRENILEILRREKIEGIPYQSQDEPTQYATADAIGEAIRTAQSNTQKKRLLKEWLKLPDGPDSDRAERALLKVIKPEIWRASLKSDVVGLFHSHIYRQGFERLRPALETITEIAAKQRRPVVLLMEWGAGSENDIRELLTNPRYSGEVAKDYIQGILRGESRMRNAYRVDEKTYQRRQGNRSVISDKDETVGALGSAVNRLFDGYLQAVQEFIDLHPEVELVLEKPTYEAWLSVNKASVHSIQASIALAAKDLETYLRKMREYSLLSNEGYKLRDATVRQQLGKIANTNPLAIVVILRGGWHHDLLDPLDPKRYRCLSALTTELMEPRTTKPSHWMACRLRYRPQQPLSSTEEQFLLKENTYNLISDRLYADRSIEDSRVINDRLRNEISSLMGEDLFSELERIFPPIHPWILISKEKAAPAPDPASSLTGLEEWVKQVQPNRVMVIDPSSFEAVPGLQEAVHALQAAGLESQVLVLPSNLAPGYLDDLVVRLLNVPDLVVTTYSRLKTKVIQQLQAKLKLFQVPVIEGTLNALDAVVREMLANLGVTEKIITSDSIQRFLDSLRLKTAA